VVRQKQTSEFLSLEKVSPVVLRLRHCQDVSALGGLVDLRGVVLVSHVDFGDGEGGVVVVRVLVERLAEHVVGAVQTGVDAD
jgi:hypothetical protein